MKHWTLSASTAITLILSAGSALAITPEEVWQNWKALATGTGGSLTTTSEARNGNALEIRGIASSFTDPEGGVFNTEIEAITLTDRGDGTVEVKMSDSYPVTFSERFAAEGKPTLSLKVSQPGTVVIASGTPAATSYDFTMPLMSVELVEGYKKDGEKVNVTFTATAADLSGKYLVEPGADGGFALDSALKGGAVKIVAAGEEEGGKFSGVFDLAGITSASKGVFIDQALMADMSKALAAGFEIDSKAEFGAMSFAFDLIEDGVTSKVTGKLDGSTFHALLNKAKVDYGLSLLAGDFSADLPAAGVPGGATSFAEAAFAVSMPVSVTEEAGDFSYLTRLTDLTLSDSLWGMFDPSNQLARDPATLVVDLKGKGAWNTDIFAQDPIGTGAPAPEMPARLDSLEVVQVLLKLAAAQVSANGALTFDNSDLQTFQGFPAPEGKITVNLAGVSALLDKLVAMGFVSPDDLTAVRMGLAMFSRPGAGPDELVSEIEFRNKGLFVNGQQIM